MLSIVMNAAFAQVPVVVDVEWRSMFLGQHVSHGPGVGVSVGLLGDHLRVGVGGVARPGPINPVTFELTPEAPYNGQDTLALRSDGGLFGVVLAPGVELTHKVRLDAPLMLGYGGFGFYLVGDDRVTPDGALPSTWEDQLMDGRDSSLGLGLDAGVRLTWTASEHARPYLAVRYTTIFGYDAFLRSDYSGASVGLGVSVGRF
ncbi:MAG: hypothetical protein KTR31_22330 [Myxococcales bacterium]|nr:hypothetical protein [Myxococcales bacterium]